VTPDGAGECRTSGRAALAVVWTVREHRSIAGGEDARPGQRPPGAAPSHWRARPVEGDV
jgi:hypothetical protein